MIEATDATAVTDSTLATGATKVTEATDATTATDRLQNWFLAQTVNESDRFLVLD